MTSFTTLYYCFLIYDFSFNVKYIFTVENGNDENTFIKLQKVISRFDRECISDEAYDKVYSYAQNLDPERLSRKHSHIGGLLADWVQSVIEFSAVLRDTAKDREELRRLSQVLEHRYSEDGDEDFVEVDDDGYGDDGWA